METFYALLKLLGATFLVAIVLIFLHIKFELPTVFVVIVLIVLGCTIINIALCWDLKKSKFEK